MDLFSKWRRRKHHKGGVFVKDGIVDKTLFVASDRKVLFLFKEAYDAEASRSWDLCALLRDDWRGIGYNTWWNTARWAYALHKTTADSLPKYPDSCGSTVSIDNYLLASAVVNVKKSHGVPRSDPDELLYFTEKDADLLKAQIKSISPDIILCGYTFDCLEFFLPRIKPLHDDLMHRHGDTLIIDYWHPAAQYPHIMMYHSLCSLMQHALRSESFPWDH